LDSDRRHRNLLLSGAALLWALALGASPVSAQATGTPAASAKEQCSQGQAGDKQDESPKEPAAPPAYKLLRYDEDYS